jgi:hypothetical protein
VSRLPPILFILPCALLAACGGRKVAAPSAKGIPSAQPSVSAQARLGEGTQPLEETRFTDQVEDISGLQNSSYWVFGDEWDPEYKTTKTRDTLIYDPIGGIGFKTDRQLPETLELRIQPPGSPRQTLIMDSGGLDGATAIYSCFFLAHAQYRSGAWQYSIHGGDTLALSGEIKVETMAFTVSDVENPGLSYDTRKSYSAHKGTRFYLYFKNSERTSPLVLYREWQYGIDAEPEPEPGSKASIPLIPTLAADPPAVDGICSTTLTIGNDLRSGRYLFGTMGGPYLFEGSLNI